MRLSWSFFFFLFVFSFFFSGCILILLIFSDKIVHIRFSFCEFHLIHTFTCVPMKKCFSSEHGCELFTDSFKHFLNCCRVTDESNGHFKTFRWNITNRRFNVIRNPLNEIRGVFVLNIKHLFIYFFRWHSTSEHSGCSKISSMSWVRSTHHILGVEHLLGEFWYCEGSIDLRSSGCKWSETSHEKFESREWY